MTAYPRQSTTPAILTGYNVLSQIARRAWRIVGLWNRRLIDRRHLMHMSDHLIHDIGLSHGDVYRETRKPFWRT